MDSKQAIGSSKSHTSVVGRGNYATNLGKFAKKTCSHEDLARKVYKKNDISLKEVQKMRKNSAAQLSGAGIQRIPISNDVTYFAKSSPDSKSSMLPSQKTSSYQSSVQVVKQQPQLPQQSQQQQQYNNIRSTAQQQLQQLKQQQINLQHKQQLLKQQTQQIQQRSSRHFVHHPNNNNNSINSSSNISNSSSNNNNNNNSNNNISINGNISTFEQNLKARNIKKIQQMLEEKLSINNNNSSLMHKSNFSAISSSLSSSPSTMNSPVYNVSNNSNNNNAIIKPLPNKMIVKNVTISKIPVVDTPKKFTSSSQPHRKQVKIQIDTKNYNDFKCVISFMSTFNNNVLNLKLLCSKVITVIFLASNDSLFLLHISSCFSITLLLDKMKILQQNWIRSYKSCMYTVVHRVLLVGSATLAKSNADIQNSINRLDAFSMFSQKTCHSTVEMRNDFPPSELTDRPCDAPVTTMIDCGTLNLRSANNVESSAIKNAEPQEKRRQKNKKKILC
ncbi:hypothetical protein HELRODRAFT_160213 [Helobdella robusta]|uniref:Uncharacterized protein n=1 Tax=Helobdella robusta TaxID=6412 RepID=T1EPZ6_HELRO|nr:hypothetical protein HELRODRAFT_160213 [Helobdella robusta]ESO06081.1 hypothetical protein HELRODRAFT_160213 [Helobdella robusta]